MSETQQGEALEVEDVKAVPESEVVQDAPRQRARFEDLEAEDQQYSFNVKKRIARGVRQLREAELRAEQADRRAFQAERMLAEQLKERLAATDAVLLRDIDATKARHSRAYHDADGEALTTAAADLADLAAQRNEIQRQQRHVQVPQQQPQPGATTYTPATQAYIDANPWFQDDPEARDAAIAADKAAISRGIKVDTPEYFDFITSRVKPIFPEHFDERQREEETEPQPARAVPPIAPARRTVPGMAPQRGKLPSLSADEVAMAKRMGISVTDYATSKAALAAAGKL